MLNPFGLIGLALGLLFFHLVGRTELRFKASRQVPTLLRVLLLDKYPCTWPRKRAVDRLFLDFPDLGGDVDIPAVVREAKRLGLVTTGTVSNIYGHEHLFVGYAPEVRRDCLPAPEAREQRRLHCGENCEHDDSCPFNARINPGPES